MITMRMCGAERRPEIRRERPSERRPPISFPSVPIVHEMITHRKLFHYLEKRVYQSAWSCRRSPAQPWRPLRYTPGYERYKRKLQYASLSRERPPPGATPAPMAGPDKNDKAALATKATMLISGGKFADLNALRDGDTVGAFKDAADRPFARGSRPFATARRSLLRPQSWWRRKQRMLERRPPTRSQPLLRPVSPPPLGLPLRNRGRPCPRPSERMRTRPLGAHCRSNSASRSTRSSIARAGRRRRLKSYARRSSSSART